MEPNSKQIEPIYTLWDLVIYMLKLGTWGFGGPVALVGYMYRDLVEKNQWISESDYKEGMALAQMAPGPLAAQLAIYLGYVHYRLLGATLVGFVFIIPSFLMVVALGWTYVYYGELEWMKSVFYGVGAAVIGIIAISAQKLTKKSLGKDKLLWAIFLVLTISTVITQQEMVSLVLGAGLLTWLVRCKPNLTQSGTLNGFVMVQAPAGISFLGSFDQALLTQIGIFFGEAGVFVFGSGLAIVPFLYGGVVVEHHWLTEKQFVDAVAVAMITPGPVVITVGFIGYLIAGFTGATVAALATFVPCYLFTVISAPYFKKFGKNPSVVAFIDGITAAAIGAIAGSVIVIGQRSIVDFPTTLLAIGTTLILWKFKKLTEPTIIAVAALVGMVIYPLVH